MRKLVKLRSFGLSLLVLGAVFGPAAVASADSIGPISFEPPAYSLGNINGQNGWMKTGPYDAAVSSVASFPAAAGYGFGTQALRSSDAITSGSFGDQTFTPGLASPAGESTGNSHFEASFSIGTALATEQVGLHMSVSPDDGNGSRMSYLRFEDHPDGVHVFFSDVSDPGPLGTVADFSDIDIAVLDRASAHTIKFVLDLKPGPGNDVVKIYIDGLLEISGTTWEDYYRYDPEQIGNGNVVPTVSKVLFREAGDPNPANLGKGFLIDRVSLSSSNPPADANACKKNGWMTHTRADGSPFKNQGDCIQYVNTGK